MSNLEKAIQIAVNAHTGQTRKNGTPYVLHPFRVMFRQTSEAAMIVGVLHDVVEDTDVTLDDLREAGFEAPIIQALALLSHAEATPYEEYIKRIACNPLARSVKLADLEDNMDLREIPQVAERDLSRTMKYHRAWKRLTRVEQADPGGSSEAADGLAGTPDP